MYEIASSFIFFGLFLTILQAAATNYIELILKESDNNVKLIVLDKLIKLKSNPNHEKVLQVCVCLHQTSSQFVSTS